MTKNYLNEVVISARDEISCDLDFEDKAVNLKEYIESECSHSTRSIVLDLRFCVFTYSTAGKFIDSCFSRLESNKVENKELKILTTFNYFTREYYSHKFFRDTYPVRDFVEKNSQLEAVCQAVDQYCKANMLKIMLVVFSGENENLESPELYHLQYPEKTERISL